jgi:acetyltransferase
VNAIAIRPAVLQDRGCIQALVRELTPRSRYLRFFNGVHELSQTLLERFSRADPQAEYTLLALAKDRTREFVAGMAQYAADPYPSRCEFAVVVADAWQGMGIGAHLVRSLVCAARAAGFERIEGEVLAENRAMLDLARGMGFRVRRDKESALFFRVSLPLSVTSWPCPQAAREDVALMS